MVKQVEEPLFSCLDLQVLVKHILQKQVSIYFLTSIIADINVCNSG